MIKQRPFLASLSPMVTLYICYSINVLEVSGPKCQTVWAEASLGQNVWLPIKPTVFSGHLNAHSNSFPPELYCKRPDLQYISYVLTQLEFQIFSGLDK